MKNRNQFVHFLLSDCVFLIPALVCLFTGYITVALFIFGIALSLLLLYIIICFWFLFQFVFFDKNGIKITFFKKEIDTIKWNEIDYIKESSVFRTPVYCLVLKDKREINLDKRKAFKDEFDKYFLQS